MTQEEKQLLFKDITARLPYGVKARIVKRIQDDSTVKDYTVLSMMWMVSLEKRLEDVKPYLRPMSSMTEGEKETFQMFFNEDGLLNTSIDTYVDWLLERHFDFRGLIPRGIALAAPEGMYGN